MLCYCYCSCHQSGPHLSSLPALRPEDGEGSGKIYLLLLTGGRVRDDGEREDDGDECGDHVCGSLTISGDDRQRLSQLLETNSLQLGQTGEPLTLHSTPHNIGQKMCGEIVKIFRVWSLDLAWPQETVGSPQCQGVR